MHFAPPLLPPQAAWRGFKQRQDFARELRRRNIAAMAIQASRCFSSLYFRTRSLLPSMRPAGMRCASRRAPSLHNASVRREPQAFWRGYSVRSELSFRAWVRGCCAAQIQASWRGYRARKELAELRKLEAAAALVIQVRAGSR